MVEDPEIAWTNVFGLSPIQSAQASRLRLQKAQFRSVYGRLWDLRDHTDCIALWRNKSGNT